MPNPAGRRVQKLDVLVALGEIMQRPLQAAATASSFTGLPMELLQLGAQHPPAHPPELHCSAPILLLHATIELNGARSPKECLRTNASNVSRPLCRCRSRGGPHQRSR